MKDTDHRWIVGLGNPGSAYAQTRHNIGAQMVEAWAAQDGLSLSKSKYHAHYATLTHPSATVTYLAPQRYMNCSGEVVSAWVRYYHIPLTHLIVVHDDIDLPFGKIRCQQGGGSGGHNGIRSLDQHIGKDYWRLKIGVGRPPDYIQAADFVLHTFAPEERPLMEQLTLAIYRKMPLLWKGEYQTLVAQIQQERTHG